MSDPFQKPTPGQPFRPSASQFGLFVDTARWVREHGPRLAGETAGGMADAGTIRVRNATGATLERGAAVGLRDPVIPPTASEGQFVALGPLTDAVDPGEADVGRFAILQEPLIAGAIGNAVVSGSAIAEIEVSAEADEFEYRFADVDVSAEDTTVLAAVGSGGARILWRESGAGTKWAVLLLTSSHVHSDEEEGFPAGTNGCRCDECVSRRLATVVDDELTAPAHRQYELRIQDTTGSGLGGRWTVTWSKTLHAWESTGFNLECPTGGTATGYTLRLEPKIVTDEWGDDVQTVRVKLYKDGEPPAEGECGFAFAAASGNWNTMCDSKLDVIASQVRCFQFSNCQICLRPRRPKIGGCDCDDCAGGVYDFADRLVADFGDGAIHRSLPNGERDYFLRANHNIEFAHESGTCETGKICSFSTNPHGLSGGPEDYEYAWTSDGLHSLAYNLGVAFGNNLSTVSLEGPDDPPEVDFEGYAVRLIIYIGGWLHPFAAAIYGLDGMTFEELSGFDTLELPFLGWATYDASTPSAPPSVTLCNPAGRRPWRWDDLDGNNVPEVFACYDAYGHGGGDELDCDDYEAVYELQANPGEIPIGFEPIEFCPFYEGCGEDEICNSVGPSTAGLTVDDIGLLVSVPCQCFPEAPPGP